MEGRRKEISRLVKDVRTLPTLPGMVTRLNTLSDDPKATIQEIARLISTDQVLSAKVLKLVNSPFYGFSGRVSTVSNALILLGVNVVRGLVLSSSIFEMMEKNLIGLWEHSFGAAVAASVVANRLKLSDAEEISTAALLHDIGKVIIKIKLGKEYDRLLGVVLENDRPMNEVESEQLDTDHAEIGEWLAKNWYLPPRLIEPIAFHHRVAQSSEYRVRTAAVHLADILVKASGFGFSGDEFVQPIQPAAREALGLTETALEGIVEEVEEKLVDAKNFSLQVQSPQTAKGDEAR
ncbi:MAG: HDOD domain-containing protein [Candidatus Manganitrophaceae bacterium]